MTTRRTTDRATTGASNIHQMIRKADSETTFEQVVVTPAIAKVLLEKNTENRNVKPRHVHELAWQMTNGAWALNPNPVSFDTDGNLIDGQHRLLAVVASGASVPMTLAFNVNRAAKDVIDYSIAQRTVSDAFVMAEIVNAKSVSAVINTLVFIERGFNARLPRLASWRIYEANKEAISWAVSLRSKVALGGRRPIVIDIAALAYAWPCDQQGVERFAEYFFSGANVPENHPSLPLAKLKMNSTHGSFRLQHMRKALRAIHAHLQGERLSILRDTDEGLKYFRAIREKMNLSPILKEKL